MIYMMIYWIDIVVCCITSLPLQIPHNKWNISKWPEGQQRGKPGSCQLCSQGTHQIAPVRLLGSSLGDSTKDWPIDSHWPIHRCWSMLLQWPKSAISIWSIQLVGLLWSASNKQRRVMAHVSMSCSIVAAPCQATIAIHSPAAWEESQRN